MAVVGSSNISGAPGSDADGIGAAAYVSFGLNKLGNKKITDKDGGQTEYTASVTVNNVAPSIEAIPQ